MGATQSFQCRALGLSKVGYPGFSIGGMVPGDRAAGARTARKLILVGTGPRGADMSASKSAEIFAGVYDPPEHLGSLYHFRRPPAGRAAGLAFLERKLLARNRDPEVSEDAAVRQREAIGNFYIAATRAPGLSQDIPSPHVGRASSNDVIIPTMNSYVLQQKLPNARSFLPNGQSRLALPISRSVRETRDALPRTRCRRVAKADTFTPKPRSNADLTPADRLRHSQINPAQKERDHDHAFQEKLLWSPALARHRCGDRQAAGGRWRQRGDHLPAKGADAAAKW